MHCAVGNVQHTMLLSCCYSAAAVPFSLPSSTQHSTTALAQEYQVHCAVQQVQAWLMFKLKSCAPPPL
jgi:hypothetical protein